MKLKQLTALLTAAAIVLCGCSGMNKEKTLTYTDTLFDTVINIQIFGTDNEELINGCEELCRKYDTMFSRTNENSEIYKINTANGQAVEVSQDTVSIIKEGIYYSELSGGAFDITIGTVSSLWDFRSEDKIIPSDKTIASALSHINYNNIKINGNTVQLTDPETKIDVGALAKGYIADRVKEYLVENNVEHARLKKRGR